MIQATIIQAAIQAMTIQVKQIREMIKVMKMLSYWRTETSCFLKFLDSDIATSYEKNRFSGRFLDN